LRLWNSLTLGNGLGGLVTGSNFSLFKDCTCNGGVDGVPGSGVPDQYTQPVFNHNDETKEVKEVDDKDHETKEVKEVDDKDHETKEVKEADDKDQYKQDEPEVLRRLHLQQYFKRGVNKSGV